MIPDGTPRISALSNPVGAQPLSEPEVDRLLGRVTGHVNLRRRVGKIAPQVVRSTSPEATADFTVDGALATEQDGLPARLDGMYGWQNEATILLQDLIARRSGIGPGSRPIPDDMEPRLSKTTRRLIVAMSKGALAISTAEAVRRRWHAAADAAREAIRLRSEVAGTGLGESLRPDAKAHLKLAHATFMLEGNSSRLRRELGEAIAQNPSSQGLPYWQARYEIMVGNFVAAHEAAMRAPEYPQIKNKVLPIIESARTGAPWIPFPSNFYTYRHSLIEDDDIRGMQQALTELVNNDELVDPLISLLQLPEGAKEILQELAEIGIRAMTCFLLWNRANRDAMNGNYASAARNYAECQSAVLTYFAARYPDNNFGVPSTPEGVYTELVRLASILIRSDAETRHIWTFFRERYMALSLEELYEHDWKRPTIAPLGYQFYNPLPDLPKPSSSDEAFVQALLKLMTQAEILMGLVDNPEKVEEKVDAPLLALALVFAPLGIAEANRMRRNFDEAISECRKLLQRHQQSKILCEFIEKPFVKILEAQVLLEKADGQYKARLEAGSPELDDQGNPRYQGLEAAETYKGVFRLFEDQGEYINRVVAGAESLKSRTGDLLLHSFHPLLAEDGNVPAVLQPLTPEQRRQFRILGKEMPIETIDSKSIPLPGLDRRAGPHEELLRFEPPQNQLVLKESNPLIYALITEAQARLMQLEAGFNYLGYRDDYVPPWRFRFLLERARYFSEHAKNAQREYLNFLANAEREEFQEMSAAQGVVMEKANIRIETARVEQAEFEVEAAKESQELADLVESNSEDRFNRFEEFDERADDLSHDIISGAMDSLVGTVGSGAFAGAAVGSALGPPGALAGAIIGGGFAYLSASGQNKIQGAQLAIAAEQREFEEFNLGLAISEARQSADIAAVQLGAAQAGLVVAGMQRAAALLRHEFAVQSLTFLRNRTLDAEMWYRLAHLIRGVSQTYLRYAVELAFLAEQAYEFEADKRINVIRFDYEESEIGDMLAADFLSRDLDTLEQDLITAQRLRQQQVRYVLSLAREFPQALQELRETGSTIFSLRLEQLERRFPGLYNLRIGSVEVMPVALMDPTRYSLELTNLGTSQVRLKSQPDTPPGEPSESPLNTNDLDLGADQWLAGLDQEWPVKIRVTGPETTVYSGLTRQEREAVFPFVSASQRDAFESLGAAASWRIDMPSKENQVVPGTLADMLITFNLSGYYDPGLRRAIDTAPRPATALTQWLSAQQSFPDAFYEFNHTGLMEWEVTEDMLSLAAPTGALRNVAMILTPTPTRTQFGHIMSAYLVEFTVTEAGELEVLSDIPQVTFAPNGLTLDAQAEVPAGGTVSWDFGEDAGFQEGDARQHTYSKPGKREVGLRVVRNGRLSEYTADIVVSRNHEIMPPLTAFPALAVDANAGNVPAGHTRVVVSTEVAAGESVTAIFRVNGQPAKRGPDATFDLEPGTYTLAFTAVRDLMGRIYSRQRHDPDQQIPINALRVASNWVFDEGNPPTPNALTEHLFANAPISPVDRWTLELRPEDNPFLRAVTLTDEEQIDLAEIEDAVLTLEYDTVV